MDFGIAKFMGDEKITKSQMSTGTWSYMSPEQIKRKPDIDGRADQYAVAIMLYEMLSGELPIGRIESLTKLVKGLPKRVHRAVDRALSGQREQRFDTIEAFNRHLQGKRAPGSRAFFLGLVIVAGGLWAGYHFDLPSDPAEREVARLEAALNHAQNALDDSRKTLASDVQSAKADVERTTAQLKTARDDADKMSLQSERWKARARLEYAETRAKALEQALNSDGFAGLQTKLNTVAAAKTARDWTQAAKILQPLQAAYTKAKDVPEQSASTLANLRTQWLQALEGRWSTDDCETVVRYSVQDPIIRIDLPGRGSVEEEILKVSKEEVISVVLNQERYKGRFYRYQLNGKSLLQTELESGRSGKMQRCG